MNKAFEKHEAVNYPAMPYTEDYSYASDWVMEGAKEYASQQTATLQARVQELEAKHEKQSLELHSEILAKMKIASRISELERENERLLNVMERKNDLISDLNVKLHSSKQHAETLMGLLEKQIRSQAYRFDRNADEYLQSYCKENGLQSPENKNN